MKLQEVADYSEIPRNQDIAKLLGYAMVSPTPGKIKNVAQVAYAKQQGHFFTALDDAGVLVGIIGYKTIDNNQIVILHVAVAEDRRGQGIGRFMVDTVKAFLPKGVVRADADARQFRFFKALGFVCELAPESEYGTSVYTCSVKVSPQKTSKSQ